MGSCAVALLMRSLAARKVSRRRKFSEVVDDEARRQRPFIYRLLDVPSHDMLKGIHEPTVAMGEGQHLTDVHLLESVEEGMVDRFTTRRILQRPPALGTAGVELHGRILARGNTL